MVLPSLPSPAPTIGSHVQFSGVTGTGWNSNINLSNSSIITNIVGTTLTISTNFNNSPSGSTSTGSVKLPRLPVSGTDNVVFAGGSTIKIYDNTYVYTGDVSITYRVVVYSPSTPFWSATNITSSLQGDTTFYIGIYTTNATWNINIAPLAGICGSNSTFNGVIDCLSTSIPYTPDINSIWGGTYQGLTSSYSIYSGTFNAAVTTRVISGGTFNSSVTANTGNNLTISGGTFNSTVTNVSGFSVIVSSGSTAIFNAAVSFKGTIGSGTFNGTFNATGATSITGGIFNNFISQSSPAYVSVTGGYYYPPAASVAMNLPAKTITAGILPDFGFATLSGSHYFPTYQVTNAPDILGAGLP
jgi:hypothetical protein